MGLRNLILFVGHHIFRFVRIKSSGQESSGHLSSMMDHSIEVVKLRSIQISEGTSVFWSQNTKWQRARETIKFRVKFKMRRH